MDQEFKKKWIAALTDGSYKRGRHRLKNGNRYCCLGVAADLKDRLRGDCVYEGRNAYRTYMPMSLCNEYRTYMPMSLCNEIGITDKDQSELANRNDAHCDDLPSDQFPQSVIDYIQNL